MCVHCGARCSKCGAWSVYVIDAGCYWVFACEAHQDEVYAHAQRLAAAPWN